MSFTHPSPAVAALYEQNRAQLVTAESTMRAVLRERRAEISTLRHHRVATDDAGWQAIRRMAAVDHKIATLAATAAVRASVAASRMALAARTELDTLRREQITDAQWDWIKSLAALEQILDRLERLADRIRDYLVGPATVDGIFELSMVATRDMAEIQTQMAATIAAL